MMPGPSLLLTGLLSLALGVGANLTTTTIDLTASTINLTAHPACVFDDDCRDFSARAVCFIYFCVDWDEEVTTFLENTQMIISLGTADQMLR